jgi:hypothetical protein
MHGWELQNVEVDCANCHGSQPHGPSLAPYNDHTSLIACETCHIPKTSGASRRVWGSTFGVTNGPEASVPQLDPTTGVYEPYSNYSPDYSARPAYRWFNGSVSMLAEPMHNANAWDFQIASKASSGAKIYPFRPIVNGMVMDRRGFGYDPQFNVQFTMAAAMDAMQGPMKMMGFMRPSGLSDRERAVLSQFPNLLPFDEEEYVHTGNVRESVNIGMGRLAMLMSGQDGYGTPVSTLSSVGSNLWSGQVFGLDLPNNPADPTFDPAADPTQVTGSFISLNHAVVRTGALTCVDCHSPNSVLDFRALSYPPEQAQRLKGLFDKIQFLNNRLITKDMRLRWSATPGRKYQLQTATDLVSANWTPIGPSNSATTVWQEYLVPEAVLTNSAQLFFRVKELQP